MVYLVGIGRDDQIRKLVEMVFRFLHGDVPLEQFEQWVYSNELLEEVLGPEAYLDLISLDYHTRWSSYEVVKVVESAIDLGEFETWRIGRLLRTVVAGDEGWTAAVASTYEEYCAGYTFLDNLAFGWGLNASMHLQGDSYGADFSQDMSARRKAAAEAERALAWLHTGKVRLLGTEDQLGQHEFVDTRSSLEKKARAYRRTTLDDEN